MKRLIEWISSTPRPYQPNSSLDTAAALFRRTLIATSLSANAHCRPHTPILACATFALLRPLQNGSRKTPSLRQPEVAVHAFNQNMSTRASIDRSNHGVVDESIVHPVKKLQEFIGDLCGGNEL